MDRRTLLGALPFVVLGGCAEAPTDDPLRLSDASLRDTGRCDDPETATVDVSSSRVRVAGCVTGPNGCAVASFGSATVAGDRLEVIVTTRRDAPPDAACTEALVHRGYVATLDLASGGPATVRVIHDAAGGRRRVAEMAVDS
ncbi:hypothetical protein [Haloplanus pelagicus]|uniref:hypothetical protein n=1 Tax=Haloplanus pelagicus TaxID=2949995 RepID=UPI00203BFAE3|nr:hypothetical protein [Haloplanus sp. HW8-1]